MPETTIARAAAGAVYARDDLAMQGAAVDPSVGSLTSFVGGFHPVVVHLPIGIFALAVGLELLAAVRRRLAPAVDGAQSLVLGAALASAVLAFALGIALGSTGGYPSSLLDRHRAFAAAAVLGVATTGAAWWAHRRRGAPRLVPRVVMSLTLGAITATGHLGGDLSRGEGHLLASAPPAVRRLLGAADVQPAPSSSAAPPPTEPLVFDDVVRPLLAARCVACHGPAKAKGRLRLDDLEALRRGGTSGPAIVAGDAGRSLLVARIHLPLADEKHMPPEGEEQLTAAEVAVLAFWIDRGATTALRVRDGLAPAVARPLLEDVAARAATAPPGPPGSPPPSPPASAADAPSTSPGGVDASPAAAPTAAAPTAPSPATPSPATPSTATLATPGALARPWPGWDAVHDVLERRCGRCHRPGKRQGGLSVASIEALEQGGDGGPAIVRGRPGAGTLLARIHAPLDDVDHMPPEDEPQLTPAELQLLTAFAGGGPPRPTPPAASEAQAPPSSPSSTTTPPLAVTTSTPAAPPPAPPAAPSSAVAAEVRRRDGAAAPRPAPASGGGCLSCAVGARRAPAPATTAITWIAAVGLVVLRRATRRARPALQGSTRTTTDSPSSLAS